MSTTLEDVTAEDVDDYLCTITGKSDDSKTTHRFPCQAEFARNVKESSYWSYDYIYVTVTNDSDETVYGMNVVAALLAEDGTIIYVSSDSLYSNEGLTAGSSIIFRIQIDEDYVDCFEVNNYEYASVDAIAYVDENN